MLELLYPGDYGAVQELSCGELRYIMHQRKSERWDVLKHIIKQVKGKEFSMEEKKQPTNAVKSIFKNGRMPTREEYTSLWIRMINQIERAKANQ